MSTSAETIKQKMSEFAQLFSVERSVFQRFVIVYKYVYFLQSEPITQGILQKIFDSTAQVMGEHGEDHLDEEQFLAVKGEAIFTRQFWIYYTNLEHIYEKMKRMRTCGIDDKAEIDNLCRLFSKGYSQEMLLLSFKVVNSEVFDELDKDCFFDKHKDEVRFDPKKSILYIRGKKVLINRQDKITNAHKLLCHIFITNKHNIDDDFYYAEIAEDEFHELNYKSRPNNWRKYKRMCQYVNEKIDEQTGIRDFLVFNSGKTGKVMINKTYR